GITKRIGRPNRRFAAAGRIPGQPDSRIELGPLPVGRRLSGEAGIAGEIKSGRSIHELRTLDAISKTIHVENGKLAVGPALRKERLPSKPVVEGETRYHFPRVR